MTKYEIIFESLQDKINSGELTVEDAEILNKMAFEKYGEETTEYEEEEVTEGCYDANITSVKGDINLIKKAAEKQMEQIDREIKRLETEKDRLYERLQSRLAPFEKKLEKYEKLNIEDPKGNYKKKKNLVTAGLTAASAAAILGVGAIAEQKQKKTTKPEKKEIEAPKTPDFKNSHK